VKALNAAETDARWWTAPELRGELDAVLNLVSAAGREAPLDEEKAARKFCDALNRAWNARARLSADPSPESDWPLVKALVSSLPDEDGLALLRSYELRELASIDPPILNHRTLLRRGLLGSVADIPDEVRREAVAAHLKLRRRLEGMSDEPTADDIQAGLVRVADLLYVIRSNLQHGEKFASPDPVRIARDRLISEKAARVLEHFFDLLFGSPSTSLAAYGSLAPGGAHHAELDGVGGEWTPAVVRGELREDPFPTLTAIPAGDPVEVQLLRNASSLRARWPRLDQLEGSSYARVLVPAEVDRGGLLITNLYSGRRPAAGARS